MNQSNTSEKNNLLKKKFKEELQNMILSGKLKPGERLPAEREMAQQFGISRGSVNQGILDLERMGFIRLVPRKGAYVAEYVKKATPETLSAIMSYDSTNIDKKLFFDLMEMRSLIECKAAELACTNSDEDAVLKLQDIAETLESDSETLAEKMYAFHELMIDLSSNASFMLIFRSFETMLKNMTRLHSKNEESMAHSIPCYKKLAKAIKQKDQEAARNSLLEIMNIATEYLKQAL